MRKLALLAFVMVAVFAAEAQTKKKNAPVEATIKGYVHTLTTYDTRQTISAREGHVLLFPKQENFDKNGKDINAQSSFNMAVIQSRVGLHLKGPQILGAKTTGLLEAEFMGNSEKDVNGLRVRHAFVNLSWGKNSLLIGQTWSPMFTVEVLPGQVGTNSGLPFKPFARNPQIRFTHQTSHWKLLAALMTQRDYVSKGTQGASNQYLRNATLPILQGQVHYYFGKHLIGASGEIKTIQPAFVTDKGYKTDAKISSWAVMAYTKLQLSPITFKLQGTYGSNLTDMLMTGGYAAKTYHQTTGIAHYTLINVLAGWCDINYQHNKFGFGVFAGYSKNFGASSDIVPNKIYSRGANIDQLYRIAPRITTQIKNMKIQLESEYTAAAYGIIANDATVKQTSWVANNRISLAIYYFF